MMSSTYLNILKDPSCAFTEKAAEGYCEYIGSIDELQFAHRKVEKLDKFVKDTKATLPHLLSYQIDTPDLGLQAYLQEMISPTVGLESTEIVQMIYNFIKKIFETIYNMIRKIITTITGTFGKVIQIDRRLTDNATDKYKSYLDIYNKSNAEEKAKAQALFRKYTVAQMCSYQDLLKLYGSFETVATVLITKAHVSIKKRIQDLDKEQNSDITWINHDFLTQLERLGITVKDKTTQYTSPFTGKEERTLEDLKFERLTNIDEINVNYTRRVWSKYLELKKLVEHFEEYKKQLEAKEKEFLSHGDINKQIVTDNVADTVKEISLCLSIFSALRQSNVTLNYRRKRITEFGIRGFSKSNSDLAI